MKSSQTKGVHIRGEYSPGIMHADHDSGEIQLQQDELTQHAWVTLNEAKGFDLIENIYEQIEKVDKKINTLTH